MRRLDGDRSSADLGVTITRRQALAAVAVLVVAGTSFVLGGHASYNDSKHRLSMAAGSSVQVNCNGDGLTFTQFQRNIGGLVCGGTTTTTTEPTTTSTTTPSGVAGVASCDGSKGMADELCWYQNTGVLNLTTPDPNDRWTEAQIVSGQASAQLVHLTGTSNLNTPGQVVENVWLDGCVNVNADNVTMRNVYIRVPVTNACNAGITTHPAGSGATLAKGFTLEHSEINGGFSTECAVPPWSGTACPETFNIGGMTMNLTGPMKLDQVNNHGGYAFMGYMAGSQIVNSYLHDVGHMHKFPQGDSRNGTANDYHHDVIWAQAQSNWSITHSFGIMWHPWPGRFGESAGCLCDQTSSNWAFVDTYMNGWANVDVGGCDTHSAVVALNVYTDGAGGGGWQTCRGGEGPANYPDYGPGAWTPQFTTSSISGQQIPVIDHSRCTNLRQVSHAGAPMAAQCN